MASNDEMRNKFASLVRRAGANVHASDKNPMPAADMGPASDLFKRSEQVSHALREPNHLPKGKREYTAYVARVITNKSKSQDNYVPGSSNVEKGREQDPLNVGTELPNYHISVFVPDIHSALYGYELPAGDGLLELYEEALVRCIPENKEVTKTYGIPSVGDEIIIYYDPMEENSLATYRRKKSSGIDLRPALDPLKNRTRDLSSTNMRDAKFYSSVTPVEYYTPPEKPEDVLIGDTKFVKKQPSAWLKTCADNNNWSAYLVETSHSPSQKSTVIEGGVNKVKQFFEPRIFTNSKALEANASPENKLFGVVLSDAAPSLRSMWAEFEKTRSSTHYGIDHYGKVHEFIDSAMVAYHSAAASCPGNNLMSIGISLCQFGFKYEHAFHENNTKNKLKPAFLNLLKGKNLFIGNPDYVGLPQNILASTAIGISNDTYLMSSREGMESAWKLTSCLSNKYNIPLDTPAIVKYMRANSNLPLFKDVNRTPYLYNFNDLSTSIKTNALCGYDGLINYPGTRARSWMTAGKNYGGSATEYYMYCRMLNFNSEEAYYATLGTMVLPGTTAGSKIKSSDFINVQAYVNKYGPLFTTKSFVPNPSEGKGMLIEAGKKVFNVADTFRKNLIVENTLNAENTPGSVPINFGATAGYQIQDAWEQFLNEKDNYLSVSPTLEHCLYIVESARKKVFAELQYMNDAIPDSKYSEFSTALGKYITTTAVNMMHVSAKHINSTNPLTITCANNPEFESEFMQKYKISFKQILNL